MPTYALTDVSDETLLAELAALVATDRRTTAALLAHLAEVEARGLYLPAACSSMFSYCTRVLHLSEDAAYKRIRAARVARRFPALFEAIADGRLHLTAVSLLATHVTDENVDELISAASHRSKADLEILIARLAPRPDVPEALTPITPAPGALPLPELVPEPVADQPPAAPPRVMALAPERFALQLTITQATRDKLERARALLRHRNPSGDLTEVLDHALDALLDRLEKQKFGATSRPRATKARRDDADPRYVSNEVKRAVHERAGQQCSFVGANGVRCTARGFIELDHRTPVALGGQPTTDEIRVLCRPHNQYEAERILGPDIMRAKRDGAKAARAEPVGASSFDADVSLALRGMGWKADETRRAIAQTSRMPASTLEDRLRHALAELTRAHASRASRCSDGSFDRLHPRMAAFLDCFDGSPVTSWSATAA
jgi:hypothetical protein